MRLNEEINLAQKRVGRKLAAHGSPAEKTFRCLHAAVRKWATAEQKLTIIIAGAQDNNCVYCIHAYVLMIGGAHKLNMFASLWISLSPIWTRLNNVNNKLHPHACDLSIVCVSCADAEKGGWNQGTCSLGSRNREISRSSSSLVCSQHTYTMLIFACIRL